MTPAVSAEILSRKQAQAHASARERRLLTPQEFANLTGVSAWFINCQIRAGKLEAWRRKAGKSIRYGIDRDQVPIFLARQHAKAVA